MTTTMVQRHTLADGFLPVGDEKTQSALKAAQQSIGDATWKAGYSKETRDQVRKTLKANGVEPVASLSGRLVDVSHAQTTYNGNTFDKLRVTLEQGNGDTTILTGDMRSEFSQRLLAKLDAVTQTTDRTVTIGGFAEPVTRNGKTFVNHVATIKGEDGQEIKAAPGHFAKAAERGQAAADALTKAGVKQPRLIQDARDAARTEYFTELTGQIQTRLLAERQVTPIEQAGQVSGRFVSAKDTGPDRAQLEVQRAGQTVLVDLPRQALPEGIEPGTPIKLRYDRNNGVTAEVGKAAQAQDKSRGI